MSNLLATDFVPPTRPYSQRELTDNRDRLRRKLHLGQTYADHQKCGHFYLVKENGRKEKEILETGTGDVGNCSVCWKLSKTPKNLKDRAEYLVIDYMDVFCKEHPRLDYEQVDLESVFYQWLYESN